MVVLPLLKRGKTKMDFSRSRNIHDAANSRERESEMGLDRFGDMGGATNTGKWKNKIGVR